jgi:hypothetical protein
MINEYITTNFHIAVWLMMNNINLKDVKWSEERADFIFEDFAERDNLVNEFFKQEEVQGYISNSQKLKSRMYANRSPKVYDKE